MPRIRYDVSDVEDGDFQHVKPGLYIGRVEEINQRESGSGNGPMLEVILKPVKDARGRRLRDPASPSNVYTYILLAHRASAWKLKEFIAAFGLSLRGTFDPDRLVGREVQMQLKSDRDLDENYRPRVGKLMKVASESAEEESDEDEEPDEEGEAEETVEEAVAEMSRTELKALVREHELEVRILKGDSDDDLRAKIVEAWPDDEAEEESDEDEEPDEEGEAEAEDYSAWSMEQLRAELRQRGLRTDGRTRALLIKRLEKDDESDEEPF